KLYTEATDGLREREGKPIVDVVTLAGWLLAYAPLLLPERLVAVTKVCRLLRGEDDDSLRLLGKALAISVASAFSVVDLRSSKLMRCIAMAQKSMLIVGSVDMSLVDMALRPLDGEDVSMMLNVLCEDVKRIAGGVFSATKWSDHQINAFRTLRHIMRSNSQGVRGNSVFSMNERLEGLADFRLTVHDAEDQMVLDHNASVVIPASSLPPIRIPAPPPPPAVPSTTNALPAVLLLQPQMIQILGHLEMDLVFMRGQHRYPLHFPLEVRCSIQASSSESRKEPVKTTAPPPALVVQRQQSRLPLAQV
ncbi:Hypothetical protein, putative, partial [Bodo saltans]